MKILPSVLPAAALLIFGSQALAADVSTPASVLLDGSAVIQSTAGAKPLGLGEPIPFGKIVLTKTAIRAKLGDTIVSVEPETAFRLVADASGKVGVTLVRGVISGTFPSDSIIVRTAYGVVNAGGSTSSISSSQSLATLTVTTTEGTANVATKSGEKVSVSAGNQVFVDENGAPAVTPILVQPAATSPATSDRATGVNNAPAEIIPATPGPQAFVTAEGEYMRYVSNGSKYNFGGGEIAAGTSFGYNDSGHFDAQVSVGYLRGNVTPSGYGYYGISETAKVVPLLASLRYDIHLNPNGTSVFYIGPTAGAVFGQLDVTATGYYNSSASATATTYIGGGDAGFKFHLGGGLDFTIGGAIYKVGALNFTSGGNTFTEPAGVSYIVKAGLSYRF